MPATTCPTLQAATWQHNLCTAFALVGRAHNGGRVPYRGTKRVAKGSAPLAACPTAAYRTPANHMATCPTLPYLRP